MQTKPWLHHYDPGVPATLAPYPAGTLLDCVAEAARMRPASTALYFKGSKVTHAELYRQSSALAAALMANGVRRGDCVAMLVPNSPQALIGQFGAWMAGAVVAPLNPLYTAGEIEHALVLSGATVVITLTPYYDKVKAVQARTAVRQVIATNIREYLPLGLRVAFTLLKEKQEGHRITLRAGDLWLSDCLAQAAPAEPLERAIKPDDAALLIFTGGTTGSPKAAVGTHGSLLMAGLQLHAWVSPVLQDWQDAIMLALPLFHAAGNVGVLTTGLIGHHPLVLVPNPRDLKDLVETIHKTSTRPSARGRPTSNRSSSASRGPRRCCRRRANAGRR
jgi:long-chain acyl-CoA synthetase